MRTPRVSGVLVLGALCTDHGRAAVGAALSLHTFTLKTKAESNPGKGAFYVEPRRS